MQLKDSMSYQNSNSINALNHNSLSRTPFMTTIRIKPETIEEPQVRLTEIFQSLQGETSYQGFLTTFVRLTGCPLRCQYCDTAYAFKGGEKTTLTKVLEEVKKLNSPYVCVTGGEPLAQKPAYELINRLADQQNKVSVETSGAMSIQGLHENVKVILDVKTPDSLECDKNDLSNMSLLKPLDEVKFVICSFTDFQWATNFVQEHLEHINSNQILYSPSYEQIDPADLAQWIIDHKAPGRLQLQLHKALWGEKKGV